jgi:ABC-2 type transport system permease protein
MNPRNVLAIVAKDLRDGLKNHLFLLLLAMPLVLWLLFRLLPNEDSVKVEVVAFDQGSSSIVSELASEPALKLYLAQSEDQVRQKVSEGFVGGFALDGGFDGKLMFGAKPEIRIYMNAAKSERLRGVFLYLLDSAIKAKVDQSSIVTWKVVVLNEEPQAAAQSQEAYFLAFFLTFTILMMGTMTVPWLIAEEYEKHTLNAILLSPTSTWEFILGKAIVGLIYTLVICSLLLLLNYGPQGSIAPLLVSILVGAWMLAEIGLLEGALFNNVMQVNAWGSMVFLLLFLPTLVSGAQGALGQVMRLIPTWYLYEALSNSMKGGAVWSKVWPNILVMVGVAVFLGLLGPWILNVRLKRG